MCGRCESIPVAHKRVVGPPDRCEAPGGQQVALEPYSPTEWRPATVHPDSHIQFHKRLYSVPFALIGQRVWVRTDAHSRWFARWGSRCWSPL